MKASIKDVRAREVLDSRGLPTVEVEVVLASGLSTKAIAPAGTSTGKYEALELRDGEEAWYGGNGTSKAVVQVVERIRPALVGQDPRQQREIDNILCELDGTPNKARIGANSIVATSLAVAKAGALCSGVPVYKHVAKEGTIRLPLPWIYIMGGGVHAKGAVDFQEFLVAPVCADSYRECFHIVWKVLQSTRKLLRQENAISRAFYVGPGLAPTLSSNEEAISILVRAIEDAGYEAGKEVVIYLDIAASHFFSQDQYTLISEKRTLSSSEMVDYLASLATRYPIQAIEDGLSEEDWSGWIELTARIGKTIELVGDDLFVTNPDRLERGIHLGTANSILIKINQIGTVTEALDTVQLAQGAGYRTVISARSGESEDPVLAHLAVAFGVDEGKLGAVVGAESTGRFNELLVIEKSFGKEAVHSWKN